MDLCVLALQQSTAGWSTLASDISQLKKSVLLMATNKQSQYDTDGISVHGTYRMKEGSIAGCK